MSVRLVTAYSSILASIFVVTACDDGAGSGSDAGIDTLGSDVGAAACESPIVVSSVDDVRDALAGLAFIELGPYTESSPPISVDLEVVGTVTLDIDDFDTPSDCLARSDCRGTLTFQIDPGAEGITPITADAEVSWLNGYQTVAVTDTVFRIRPLLVDTHPWLYNIAPVLKILPSCDAECGENHSSCPTDHVCYDTSRTEYCRLCEGQDAQTCACWTPNGPLANGTECTFMLSSDAVCLGHCDSGVCWHGEPGVRGCY